MRGRRRWGARWSGLESTATATATQLLLSCTWTDRSATSNPQIRGWSLPSSKQAVLGSLGLSFFWGKRGMEIAIETETETGILNPMCSQNSQGQVTYQLSSPSSSFHATSQRALMRPGNRGPASGARLSGRKEASCLKLLLLARVGWRCQLPVCEPDCLPSCAPHQPRWAIIAFISTSPPPPTCSQHTSDHASDDSLLIVNQPHQDSCEVCHLSCTGDSIPCY